MPIDFVFWQLPNMSIYFNKILGTAAILYIVYFLIQRMVLDAYIKASISLNKYWYVNRILGIFRLLPIVLIVFAMYNIDNESLLNGLQYNECQTLIKENTPIFFDLNGRELQTPDFVIVNYSTRTVHGVNYTFPSDIWEYIDNGAIP